MKKYIFLLALLGLSVSYAQDLDRSQIPAPGPAPEIQITTPPSFTLDNGLRVFVVENHKLPQVTFSLFLDLDPFTEGATMGYTSLAGQLMGTATASRTKDEIDDEVDFLGASLSVSSSGAFASSLTRHTEKLLEILSDVMINAKFTEEEFEKAKKQTLSGLASQKDSPEAIMDNIARQVIYGKDHPYGEFETEETVGNISLEQCREYYKTYFKPNKGYMTVSGDINLEKAKGLVEKYFSAWEKAEVPSHAYDMPVAPKSTQVSLVNRSSAVQSNIEVTYPVDQKPGSPDAIPASVMDNILGGGFSGRLFANLREDKAFTYGAYSSLDTDEWVGSFSASASVRNAVTDSAIHEFLYEMKRIAEEEVSQEELDRMIAYMSGSFARQLENPQTLSRFATNIERYNLPKDYYQNYLKNLSAVTIKDIQRVAKKYIRPENAHIVIVGNVADMAESLSKYGPITWYDMDGNSYDPAEKAATPAGLTPEAVIQKYIAAIGGEDALDNIKDISYEMGMSMQGMDISLEQKMMRPNRMMMVVSGMGQVFQKIVTDGERGKMSGMQGEQVLEGDELEELKAQGNIFPETSYAKDGYKLALKGTDKVGGKEAYILEVESPSGKKSTEYYAVESGLKLKEIAVQEGPQGATMTQSTEYGDYQEVDGVKFPHSIKQNLGPQLMDIQVKSITVNSGLSKDDFKVE